MQKVNFKKLPSILSVFSLAFMLAISTTTFAQEDEAAAAAGGADATAGKALFNANCAACHKLYKKATGPALYGVGDKYEKEWLYKWVRNSAGLIASGDAQANEIFEQFNKSPMTAFPGLSDADIDNIIAYTYTEKVAPPPPPPGSETVSTGEGVSNNVILGALALVFGLLILMLVLVTRTLKKIASANGIDYPEKEQKAPIWKAFIENQFMVLVSAILLLLTAGYFMYGYFMQVGIDQGYAPVQPIHFSHKIHAGDNEVDCNYCHSSARKSKTSGIPSLNVCMNCHKSISEYNGDIDVVEGYDKAFYDNEIQKLYKAAGWDDANQAYTGVTEPVKWVRIHNLPDFAYFNHSQHVTVGGIACQKCHGPVEEMEILGQHAPLTMGWCINCHRETNVKLEGNEYYDKIHKELSKKYGVDKFTAADMGALECGKCHY